MRQPHLVFVTLSILPTLLAAGCQNRVASGSSAETPWQRRAALFRGATDNAWKAVKQRLDNNMPTDPRYLFALSELRTGAISAELKLGMAERFPSWGKDAVESQKFITDAEPVLIKLLADGPEPKP